MALTKKDKEEIRHLIIEILDGIKSGEKIVEQGIHDYMLEQIDESWLENGIKSETAGLIIAPEDYTESDKKYFTWDEAMALDLPDGWRLPTRHEWVLICEEFANGPDGRLEFPLLEKALGLKKNGYYDPEYEKVDNQGSNGHYWSATAYSAATYAYSLSFDSSNVSPQGDSSKYYGFSVRLVKDTK